MTTLVRRRASEATTNFDGYAERLTTGVIGRRRRRRPGRRCDVSDFVFVLSVVTAWRANWSSNYSARDAAVPWFHRRLSSNCSRSSPTGKSVSNTLDFLLISFVLFLREIGIGITTRSSLLTPNACNINTLVCTHADKIMLLYAKKRKACWKTCNKRST